MDIKQRLVQHVDSLGKGLGFTEDVHTLCNDALVRIEELEKWNRASHGVQRAMIATEMLSRLMDATGQTTPDNELAARAIVWADALIFELRRAAGEDS